MNVSIPEAGHLISIYALGVCAGAFSLILMHKYRPKKILMFLASIITIGAIIASVAPTYWHIARYHDDVYDSQMGSRRGCVAE